MANEFEKHIGMSPDKIQRSEDPGLIGRGKDQINSAARAASDTVRENPGAITTTALVLGVAGFAIGWICGQSSARSERYWH